jgi:CubicO group peptidase (beta-lactamase class C family)
VLPLSQLRAQSAEAKGHAQSVDSIFSKWDSSNAPGCAVGVSENGRSVYEHGYGMANLDDGIAIGPESIFHVASVSKQFTAMAIMLLVRDGKLSLDDEVRKYVPELPDYGKRITIRHILQHTSGLRDQWELLSLSRGRFDEDLITEANALEMIARQKTLIFEPGSRYLYSNTGFTLAAVIVERISGMSLRQFTAKRIFAPLGMTRTHFHDDYSEIVPGRASAYTPRDSGGWSVSIPHFSIVGATSLFTTVGDLLRWEDNFVNPIVGDSTILKTMEQSGVLTNGDTTGYGLGLVVSDYRGTPRIAHNGADAGYRSFTAQYPAHRLAVSVLCNAATAAPGVLGDRVADVYLGLAPLPPMDTTSVVVAASVLEAHTGSYFSRSSGSVMRLVVRKGRLARMFGGAPRAMPLISLGDDRFRINPGSELVFTSPNKAEIRSTTALHSTDEFVRIAPAPASRSTLAQYAGTYRNDELDATYWVTAGDSTLLARTRMSEGFTLYPAGRDVFDGDSDTEFVRDKSGRIEALIMSSDRVGRMRFNRIRQ